MTDFWPLKVAVYTEKSVCQTCKVYGTYVCIILVYCVHHEWIMWWFSARWLPVQVNQWHSMNTRAVVDVWQASETSPRIKSQNKQTSQLVAVVLWHLVSLLIELSIGNEKCSLPLCVYVAGFGKSGHNYIFGTIPSKCNLTCAAATTD